MKTVHPISVKFSSIAVLLALDLTLGLCGCGGSSSMKGPPPPPPASNTPFWAQWGQNPQHSGQVSVAAQSLNNKLADIVYDPFVTQEQAEQGGDLVAHYQSTLTDGNDFYMENKSGTYPSCSPAGAWANGTSCGPNAWSQLIWNVTRYTWESGQPVLIWTFQSDWKPEPNYTYGLYGWEPVFHPLLANSYIYIPGAGGTVWKVDKNTGKVTLADQPIQRRQQHPGKYFCLRPTGGGRRRQCFLQRDLAG